MVIANGAATAKVGEGGPCRRQLGERRDDWSEVARAEAGCRRSALTRQPRPAHAAVGRTAESVSAPGRRSRRPGGGGAGRQRRGERHGSQAGASRSHSPRANAMELARTDSRHAGGSNLARRAAPRAKRPWLSAVFTAQNCASEDAASRFPIGPATQPPAAPSSGCVYEPMPV